MDRWRNNLKADPTEWLLERDCPPIRYRTLIEILNCRIDDPEVIAAKVEFMTSPPVAELLAAQEGEGYWGKRDFYLPRAGRGTFWVLSVLGDLGLTAADEHVRRACDFMFTHQRENGAFCRRRFIPGEGAVWQINTEPCTQARIVRFLIQFGYADDPRVRLALDWLLLRQRDDRMWFCRVGGDRGCLRATLDILRVAELDPPTALRPGINQACAGVCELLMKPRMSRYHVGEAWGTWECLKYPYFGFSVISALESLARLGCTLAEPGVAAAAEYLLERQAPSGSWPADDVWPGSPIDVGLPGQPNKWLTLDALRVVMMLYD